jgi:decaprenylphospho-beta-D-ribofuranose 2-oxidase
MLLDSVEKRIVDLSGWGGYPRSRSTVSVPRSSDEVKGVFAPRLVARGLGRSYGDAALLRDGTVLSTREMRDEIKFDATSGTLYAGAGMSLAEIISKYLPLGWFPMVTPGTKHVTLGGCLAADVHGKNHHRDGSFGEHVTRFRMVTADGHVIDCSPDSMPELFWATVGGMGLTGVITEVEMRLRAVESAYMVVRHHAAGNLSSLMDFFESNEYDDNYSVAWIDCVSHGPSLGRGVYMTGHHASPLEAGSHKPGLLVIRPRRRFRAKFGLPRVFFSTFMARAFNELYFRVQGRRHRTFISDFESFFYPLDVVDDWNLLYGRGGFLQYQCAIPAESARAALKRLLDEIVLSGHASMLGVLKRFRTSNPGPISFPIEGYTLALDFPIRSEKIFSLLDRLDAITVDYGGRIYLAKDARVSAANFSRMYPQMSQWKQVKNSIDPEGRFVSDLARRIGLV